MPSDSAERPPATGLRRLLYVVLGLFFVGMAYIGVIAPGIPTTPFVLAAGYCFGRSSPRLQRWLYRTPYFGGLLKDWEAHRGMRFAKKVVASFVMLLAISCSIAFFGLPAWACWIIAGAGAVGLCVIWGVVRTIRRE